MKTPARSVLAVHGCPRVSTVVHRSGSDSVVRSCSDIPSVDSVSVTRSYTPESPNSLSHKARVEAQKALFAARSQERPGVYRAQARTGWYSEDIGDGCINDSGVDY
jgi:hypothetical protein